MMLIKKYLTFFIVFSSAIVYAQNPTREQADPCNDILDQIYADVAKYGIKSKDQPLPWKDLSWLHSNLGEPETKALIGHLYVWDEYSLYSRNDGKQSPGFESLVKSEPPKRVVTEKITQYIWKCDSGSNLTLSMDKDNVIRDVQVTYCKKNATINCTVNYVDFSIDMSRAKLETE